MPRKKNSKPSLWNRPVEGPGAPRETLFQASEETPEVEPEPSRQTFADVDGILRDAAKFSEGLYGLLLWMDSKLVAAGQPALSPWWKYALRAYFESEKTWGLWMVGRGGGKALAVDTPIPTPNGWKMMGHLRPGDHVFDEEGVPCTVLACSAIEADHECFEVEFSDGHIITADAEHLWKTITRHDKRRMSYRATDRVGRMIKDTSEIDPAGTVKATREIGETLTVHKSGERNHTIPLCAPLQLPDVELPVDPYLLGVWLGDGTSASGQITTPDQEIVDRLRSRGHNIYKLNTKLLWNVEGLNRTLHLMGLRDNKHIPAVYLRASFEQRLELFRGLMDTDGTATIHGACNFDTTNIHLRDGFEELAMSLGIKTRPAERDAKLYGRFISKSWRFCFNTNLPIFTLPKKRDRVRPVQRCALRRYIVAVRPVPSVPVMCISVDSPSSMFLAGRGMIPTHNSTTLVRVALLYVLFGCLFAERKVPPGQRWVWPFISCSTTDAGRRINELQALLMALGLETKPKGHMGSRTIEMIDVKGNDVAFLSIAATIAGVSGPSALGGTVDEESKLRDRANHVNPSTEIIASIAQMFRSRPGVHAIRCSSAWHKLGSHYAAIMEGDTEATHVARIGEEFVSIVKTGLEDVARWEESQGNGEAAREIRKHAATITPDSPHVPTWLANPTIGALSSRKTVEATPVAAEEGNTPRWRIWLRECASVPMGAADGVTGPTVDEFNALGEATRAIAAKKMPGVQLWPGQITDQYGNLVPGDPRGRRGGGGGRSLL